MEIIVDVVFMNFLNANDRIYDNIACNKIITDFNKSKAEGIVYGELGQPEKEPSDLDRVSHIVENMWISNGTVKAKIKTLNTPDGKILKANIDDYVFSTRSLGKVEPNRIVSLNSFITIDAINWKEDPYYQRRLRNKKLERILND